MPYRANQDNQHIGLGGELTAAEELRVQEIQALADTGEAEALGKESGSVIKKEVGGSYTLPIASATTLGGIKIGTGLSIDGNGVVTAGWSMTYPGAGIPLSTGSAWGTSITNNSANWDTAYGWGNHASAGYVTGTPWTAMGYLTSLSGAVLTDQSTPQTIGLTGARLAKLWATDITCTNAIAASITGNAATITVADSTDTTCHVALFEDATGSLAAKTDGGLTYNASTGVLSATGFSGPLTGDVTGNCSGSSGSCTGNSATVTGLSVTSGKTLSVSNSLTITATDGSTLAIGTGGTLGSAAYTASTAYAAALGENDNYVTDAEKTAIGTISGKEVASNKSTSVSTDGASDTKYPSVKAVKDYADGLVAGLLDYRGGYDASGNAFPTTGGSGSAGAVLKGDMWIISVAGTLGSVAVQVGDSLIANVDTPAQTAGNWNVLNSNISYIPEDAANKKTSLADNSDTYYPTQKAVKTAVDGKVDVVAGKGLSTNDYDDAAESKLAAIEASADVTDATNVAAAGAVMESDYNANTILYATTDNTPAALTVGEQTIVGRKTGGAITALSASEVRTILNVADGATSNTKATGAELDTGTDDAKFATAKALKDSSYATKNDSQTILSNQIFS